MISSLPLKLNYVYQQINHFVVKKKRKKIVQTYLSIHEIYKYVKM